MLLKKADVVVIGAGIIGCAIAYYLSKAGKKVAVIDRKGICAGTSSAGDGFVYLQTKKPGPQLEMALQSADMYISLSEELGHEVYYHRSGGLILIDSPEILELMEGVIAKQRSQGMDVELLDGPNVRKMVPGLSENVIAAGYSELDGHVNSLYATIAFAKAAAKLGAEIYTHTTITEFKLKNGAIAGVKTDRGTIETEVVVNATGTWAAEIGNMLGIDIPVKPRRGHLMITEAIAPMFDKMLIDGRYVAIKHNPDIVKDTQDEFLMLGIGFGLEQTHNGNLIIGNSREFVGFDTSTDQNVLNAMARYSVRFLPFLKDVNIIRTFCGLRPYCVDGYPIISDVKKVPGLFLATGHEGDGIALAPITGKLITDLIMDRKPEFDLTPYDFSRFD